MSQAQCGKGFLLLMYFKGKILCFLLVCCLLSSCWYLVAGCIILRLASVNYTLYCRIHGWFWACVWRARCSLWSSLARVASSWVISPVLGASVSFLVYKCIRRVRTTY
ncbi:putative phosphate transporter [Helianthus annuus]|nr:putative phosphate transporter [Helianthus annuus]